MSNSIELSTLFHTHWWPAGLKLGASSTNCTRRARPSRRRRWPASARSTRWNQHPRSAVRCASAGSPGTVQPAGRGIARWLNLARLPGRSRSCRGNPLCARALDRPGQVPRGWPHRSRHQSGRVRHSAGEPWAKECAIRWQSGQLQALMKIKLALHRSQATTPVFRGG